MTVLDEFDRLSRNLLIAGAFRRSAGAPLPVTDPATEERVGDIAEATPDEIDAALAAARTAQPGWWSLSALARAELLHESAERMHDALPETAEMLTREMGKPYKESADEVRWSITAMNDYAEIGRQGAGRVHGPAVA